MHALTSCTGRSLSSRYLTTAAKLNALAEEGSVGELEFYRHEIAIFILTTCDGVERYKSYNFVGNVYDKSASEHLKRIKDAAAQLPASGMTFEKPDSETDPQANSQEAADFLNAKIDLSE